MRKEDRIRQQQAERPDAGGNTRQAEPRDRERMIGSKRQERQQQNPTQRQPGRLPLPD